MKLHPKAVHILLALISVLYFAAGCLPNATGAENQAMLNMFEPDEYAIFCVIDRMTSPKPNLQVFLQYFITYDYYHYDFPFFGLSALVAYPLRWTGQFGNLPLLMLVERRRRLVELADHYGVPIVEDDPYGQLCVSRASTCPLWWTWMTSCATQTTFLTAAM